MQYVIVLRNFNHMTKEHPGRSVSVHKLIMVACVFDGYNKSRTNKSGKNMLLFRYLEYIKGDSELR